MNRITPPVIFLLSVILLTSLACSVVSQIAGPNPPGTLPPEIQPEDNPAAPTPTPGTQATAPLGDGLVPPPPAGGGACANTLYPMLPGYQWIYEITAEGETSQISLTVSEVNGNQATLNALSLETGVTSEATVTCDEGAIISFPVVMLGFLFGEVDGDLNIEHQSGVYAPNYQTLSEQNWDAQWEGEYLASGSISAEVEGQQATGTLQQSPLKMRWQTPGAGEAIFAAIQVPAGEYPQAIQVSRQIDFDFVANITEDGTSMSLDASVTLHNNLWFEPNVGLLKQEIDQASVKLYGVNFPVDMTGTMELIEFRITE